MKTDDRRYNRKRRIRMMHPVGAVSLMRTRLCRMELPLRLRFSGHDQLPLSQCGRAAFLVGLAIDEVAFQVKVVVDIGVDGGELL